jgi:hypothetical protein
MEEYMDDQTRQALLDKNEKLINMVIERAKRDFPEDIAIIGLSGSFSTGDYHEGSDLDLIIINQTDRGWGISRCFILGDVGYDIYCSPWDTRMAAASNLESAHVSCLTEMKVLYCAKPEYLERLEAYKKKALDALALPVGKESVARAKRDLDKAKSAYAEAFLKDDLGGVRYAAGKALYHCVNALTSLNNTCMKRGIKRYLEAVRAYAYVPKDFEANYLAVIKAREVAELRASITRLVQGCVSLCAEVEAKTVTPPTPTAENLRGTYEELWCNYRNKIIASARAKDAPYAFLAALGAQEFLDEMAEERGTPRFDVMRHFNANDLDAFKGWFLAAMDEYLEEYKKVGKAVDRFSSIDELYESYMEI